MDSPSFSRKIIAHTAHVKKSRILNFSLTDCPSFENKILAHTKNASAIFEFFSMKRP
jgi:hypothetical protein